MNTYEELFLFMNVFVSWFQGFFLMILSDVIVFVLFELLPCVIMDDVSGCDDAGNAMSRWTGSTFGGP